MSLKWFIFIITIGEVGGIVWVFLLVSTASFSGFKACLLVYVAGQHLLVVRW